MRYDTMKVAVMGLAMMAAAATAPAAAQVVGQPVQERTIRVSGQGEVRVQPDMAQISFAVETTGNTAEEASRTNAERMNRVITALVGAGVPRERLETRGYMLHPIYAHQDGRREPRITGYTASNQVLLRTEELTRVGEFIDAALGAGANRMDGVSFELRNSAAAEAEALTNAVSNARAAAETIAAALGVRLGQVIDASTAGMQPRPMGGVMVAREMAAMSAPTPVQPGEQTVRAHVALVFEIVN